MTTQNKEDTFPFFIQFAQISHGTLVGSHIDSVTIKMITALDYFCIKFHRRCLTDAFYL